MSLKFTEELYIMAIKNYAGFEEKLICRFKIDMKNLANFDPTTHKSQQTCILMDYFGTKYITFELKSTEQLCLMALKIDAKLEGKLTCDFQNGMMNLANLTG